MMFLFKATTQFPILFEDEGELSSNNFQVGTRCGASAVVSIEATAIGTIVRRADVEGRMIRDVFITAPIIGLLLDKAKVEPAQLKAAREGK